MSALRRTIWLDDPRRPDDYEIIHAGQTVGRIYRMNSAGRELWRWTQIGLSAATHGPNGEPPTPTSEIKLGDDEVAKLKGGNYTAALLWHTSSDFVNAVTAGARHCSSARTKPTFRSSTMPSRRRLHIPRTVSMITSSVARRR